MHIGCVLVRWGVCWGGLGQESCDMAQEVFLSVPLQGELTSSSPNIDLGACGPSNDAHVGELVYRFVAPSSGLFQGHLCGSELGLDSKLSIYSGTCANPVCVSGNDDLCGYLSGVTFSANAGDVFFLLVHSYRASSGSFELIIEPRESFVDVCQAAETLIVGVNTGTINASSSTLFEDLDKCGTTTEARNGLVPYRFIPPSTGRYHIVGMNGGYVTVYQGGCETPVCQIGPACSASSFRGNCRILEFGATFEATAGEEYFVLLHSLSHYDLPIVEVSLLEFNSAPCLAATNISSDNLPITASAVGGGNSGFNSCNAVHRPTASDVFFRFVAPEAGVFMASTCGSTGPFETRISIYKGGCTEGASVCWDGNMGSCGSNSYVEFYVQKDHEFFIMVHSYGAALGDFELDVSVLKNCGSSSPLTVGTTIFGSSDTGFISGLPNCGNTNYDGLDNLYTFTPEEKGLYNIRTCSDFTYDTQLSVYEGTCDNFFCTVGNDDFCGYRSSVDFIAEAGQPFLVMVHGYSGISVDFNLTVEFLEGPQDSCEEAFPIKLGDSLLGDTGLGLVSGFPTCDGVANDPWSSDVFYRFVAPRAGDFEVTTCTDDVAEPADTKLSVYKGTCRNPVCAGGNDDAGGETCGLRSLVLFSAEEGEEVLIMVHAFRRNTGLYRVTVKAAQNICSLAKEIFLGPYIMGNTLTDGTKNTLPSCGVSNGNYPDVLYRFVAPASKRYTVSTCNVTSSTDTKLSIYGFCGDECLNGNDDSCGLKSRASFVAATGAEYLIRVEPFGASTSGPFSIEILEDEDEGELGEVQEPQETGDRPQLLDSSLHIRETQIMNHRFEYAQATLDFDQKLYLNEPLMCPFAELTCEVSSPECACDWGNVSAACWGANCCSRSCVKEDDGFIFVPLDSKSELIHLNTSESQHFRFILDNLTICAPIQISVEAEYGNAQLLVSNVHPFPQWEERLDSDEKMIFGYISSDPTYHYSQASLTLCPNPFFAQGYEHIPGVYSVGVFALQNTAFRLRISVGAPHPIPQPAKKVSCDDVPEIEFEIARGKEGSIHDVLCLEDSMTKVVHLDYPVVDLSNQVILPFPEGCHVATFTASGLSLGHGNDFEPADVYCFSTIDDEIVQINTSVIGRRKNGRDLDAITFTACDDKPFYVHCSYHFWKSEYYTLLFSTTALPKRTALVDVRPGPLAMSSGIGAVAGTIQGETHQPCVDWQKNCNEFLTPSISDPQPLWPPPGDMWIVTGHFDFPLPPDRLVDLGLAGEMEKRVTFIKYLSKSNTNLLESQSLLREGSLSVIALTNENGDPVQLPNNGKKNKKRQEGEETPQSFLDYIPNIAYSSLGEGFFPPCDIEKYEKHQQFVNERISNLLPATSFEDVIPNQYIIEVYNEAYARTSCVATAAEFLETEKRLTVIRGQTGCQYPADSTEWSEDPCCNPAAVPVACCAPYVDTVEDTVYSGADSQELDKCSSYECAESYFNDLADSLNTVNDPVTGCASGILRPEEERSEVIEEQMDLVLRACALEVGLGDPSRGGFTGVKCSQDSECSSGVCNRFLGVCHLSDYEEVEEAMLKCYISNMSSLTEDYLRENILSKELVAFSRGSPEFFAAVKASATHFDCVNTENALDFSQMTHKKLHVSEECAENYVARLSPYTDNDLIPKECPPQYCLGDICRFDKQGCYRECAEYSEFESSNTTCALANEEVTCLIDDLGCNISFSCVFCPDNGGQCEVVGSYTEEECNNLFMCVLPNGTQFITDDKDACESQQECSVDCVGAQCRGKAPGRGVCLISPPEGISYNDCILAGGINTGLYSEPDPICLMKEISNREECLRRDGAVWETCETLDVDSCTYEHLTPGQVFLGCGVDLFRTCENEEECVASGRCSDVDAYRPISVGTFEAQNPVPAKETRDLVERSVKRQAKGDGFQNGVCLTSGTHLVSSVSASRIPYCAFGKEAAIGCIEDVEEEICDGFVEYFGSFWRWRKWVTPALSEEECFADTFGHSGCQLSNGDDFHQWDWNESDCDCRLGSFGNTWTWTPGQWVGGQARPLKWLEAAPKPPVYEYRETLNFWTLAEWVERSAVRQFTDSVKSQIICEANLITSSLKTLLCDCVEGAESCYQQSTTSIQVGIRDVCAGEVSILKGPSNNILFDKKSIKSTCTQVELGMLRKASFAVSRETASVSFQFEEPEKPGVVLNKKGANVGELFGDGAVLHFEEPDLVRGFRACLRVTEERKAKIRDFGYTTGTVIYPLGLDIKVQEESFLEFWCADIKRDQVPTAKNDVIQIFPVSLISGWEDEDDQAYSDSTIALVYTLGALYACDLLLLVIFLLYLVFQVQKTQKSIPVVAWIGAILSILCVFRIIFCFMWPVEGFGDNSLAEYVVFEIPTFLLFSIVILSISFFRMLSRTNKFFVRETDRTLMILTAAAIFLVWCLFAVVAIVYSEVILEDNEATSDCPGRVEATSNIDAETRTLSIVYQSIVIAFTFILAVIFFYCSYNLFKLTARNARGASTFVFRLGAIIVSAFLLRCVLFLILLAADFTSAPYLFCTLFVTEVFMIFLIQLEFNKHFYRALASSASAAVVSSRQLGTSRSQNSHTTQHNTGRFEMDD